MDPLQVLHGQEGAPSASYESQQHTQETQQATQMTQYNGGGDFTAHLWGYLFPHNHQATELRMDFLRTRPEISIGRSAVGNTFVLPGMKISNYHCKITWDGVEDREGVALVVDTSSNGTYINGVKIPKNVPRALRSGNSISFGTPYANGDNPHEDYRFIYRHLAGEPEAGSIHETYDMLHSVGTGAFATVVRAMHRQTGEMFAIKIIHASKIRTSETSKTALGREISILQSISHPNICKLYEMSRKDNNSDIYLVLELVEGGDLLEFILSRDGLDEPMAKHVTRQACQALAYLHSKKITHRDLKPENILVTLDNPPVVKVADFGLAKVVDSETMLRTMCGTPNYLAPEVVTQTNNAGYDHLVDSWSIGVIVFCMLTAANPFIENSEAPLHTRIRERQIEWRVLQQRNVSDEAFDFISRLLEEDPRNRMSMQAALEHPWLAGPDGEFSQQGSVPEAPLSSFGPDVSMLSAFSSDASMDAGAEGTNGTHLVSNGTANGGMHSAGDMEAMPGVLAGMTRAPLERRSQVLAREEEAAGAAGSDSDEADANDEDEDAMLESPVRGGKRTRAGARGAREPLGPIEEERNSNEPKAKRGRVDAPATPVNRGGRGGARGKPSPATAPRRGARGKVVEETPVVRRSERVRK